LISVPEDYLAVQSLYFIFCFTEFHFPLLQAVLSVDHDIRIPEVQ
jgi:hypothetical protein